MTSAESSPTPLVPKLALAVVASATLAIGVTGIAAAATDSTEPAEEMTEHTEAGHTMDTSAATLAVDGSAEASSPEAEELCIAEMGLEAAAANFEDPDAIGPAIEALTAAAEGVPDAAPLVEAVMANMEDTESPAFAEAYTGMIEWMRANCGFAELNLTATEYAFGGFPPELPAGPMIVTLENIGAEVHEVAIMRINDDVTLSLEEILELPEEESDEMVTFTGIAFAFPGQTSHTVVDLTPGRYVGLCFLPQGATPEVLGQLEELGAGPGETLPADGPQVGPPHFTAGMIQEFTVT